MRDPFPTQALSWLVPDEAVELLALGSPTTLTRFANRKIKLFDPSSDYLVQAREVLPRARLVAAKAELLPFVDSFFDVVLLTGQFSKVEFAKALPEFARTLKTGGQLGVEHIIRDDSVPWVRRLAAIVQQVDPKAMSQTAEPTGIGELASSRHFPRLESRSFRMWVPATKKSLLDQVAAVKGVAALESVKRQRILDEVAQLYDSSARVPDPLLLPYKVCCWRAVVDRTYFAVRNRIFHDGFRIKL